MSNQEFADFEIQQNFSDIDAWGGEPRPLVPPGDYKLTVVGVENATAKSSQQPMVAVTFEVAEGEHAGMKVWNNYSLSPKALGRLKALMVACGASLDAFRAREIMGQTIRASVIHVEGAAQVDQSGNTLPARTFANLINELPPEEAQAQAEPTKTTAPPITKAAPAPTAKPAQNGAVRRA